MTLREIVKDYEGGRIDAGDALELSGCVSLLAMYQLLDEDADEEREIVAPLARTA